MDYVGGGDDYAIVALVDHLERVLDKHDRIAIQAINRHIIEARNRILKVLKERYPLAQRDVKDAGDAARYLRARILIAELESVAALQPSVPSREELIKFARDTQEAALGEAIAIMDRFSLPTGDVVEWARSSQQQAMIGPNYEAAAAAAESVHTRMGAKMPLFAARVEDAIVQGMLLGHGVRKVSREVRLASGMTMRAAETLVRTENHQAYDKALQESYKRSGLGYVIRIAVMDSRTCEYCAARAGMVYELGSPASLHPNDRCYMLPFSEEMLTDGTLDVEWLKRHHRESKERSKEAGHKPVPRTATAPFETTAPEAIWLPETGVTKYGRETLPENPYVLVRPPAPVTRPADPIYWNETWYYTPWPSDDIEENEQVKEWAEGRGEGPEITPTLSDEEVTHVVERWMQDRLAIDKVHLDFMPGEASEKIAKAYEDMIRLFPHLLMGLERVTTYTGSRATQEPISGVPPDPWQDPFSDWMSTNGAYAGQEKIMLLNPFGLANDIITSKYDPAYSPSGRNAYTVVQHELAHTLEKVISDGPMAGHLEVFREKLDGLSRVSEYAKVNMPEMFAETLVAMLEKPTDEWGSAETAMAIFIDEVSEQYGWGTNFSGWIRELEDPVELFPEM